MTASALLHLDQLPIDVDPAAIDAAMAPFLVPAADTEWRRALNRRVRKALCRALERLAGVSRDHQAIEEEYSAAWGAGYDRYRLGRTDLKGVPWTWRGRHLLLDMGVAARLRALFLAAVIEELRPASVLEVGSGNGINLFALAGAFPGIEFTGVELTSEGVSQATAAQQDGDRLAQFEAYSPLEVHDRAALSRIDFVQGDAAALPFGDGSFDLVLTVLAVEQMEKIRDSALREIARVSGRYVLMLEPFRDANRSALRRFYIYSRDYFRGSIPELSRVGLKPLWATADLPQEAFLGVALALSEKSTSSRA
jgi:ubiquinone/menaquinone biosynthesis C-methylase UbiE